MRASNVKNITDVTQHGEMKKLYAEHHSKLLIHIMKKGMTKAEAEDIAHEAFVKLLGLDNPNIASYINAYLYRIATNLTIDKLRRRARSPEVSGDASFDIALYASHLKPEDNTQHTQLLTKMAALVESLPYKCRRSFYLYKIKGKEYEEIAQELDISSSMVRKHVLKAVRFCFANLKDEL